jgi:maltooligosyltrehalose trehalohydrolase
VTTFRVWAPRPRRVELVVAPDLGRRLPMVRAGGGWWRARVPGAGPGTAYAFVLDDEGPFPDPRSPWQPDGVHGPSRVVDHAAFAWTDEGFRPAPLAASVLYELHVGTFTQAGTFAGAIERLPELAELGVTHIELMPVVEFPGERGWGYDGVDLFAPHHAYGGPDGLRRLVDACHAHGLGVLLDVVYNHLGPDGNYLARFGPYFSDRYTTPWGDALNFDDRGSDEVRAFIIDNAVQWIRSYHVDGLRLDAVHEIFDRSAVHLLEAISAAVHREGGILVAESDLNDPRLVAPSRRGGYAFDATWDDDLRHALHVALTGDADPLHAQYSGVGDLAAALRDVSVYNGRYSAYRDRSHGRPVPPWLPWTRFVTFLENHDQVGNRPLGERSGHLAGLPALMTGLGMVLLGPGVPLLFMGQEWAASSPFHYFTDHRDPTVARAVRDGRARDFAAIAPAGVAVPDPQDVAMYVVSQLKWSERQAPGHATILAWVKACIAFRRAHPELWSGARPAVTADPAAAWVRFSTGAVTVVASFNPESVRVPLASRQEGSARQAGSARLTLASDQRITIADGGVQFPGVGIALLEGDRS